MKWQTGRRSGNVIDRRGSRGLMIGGGLGTLVIAAVVMLLGGDPSAIIGSSEPATGGGGPADPAEQQLADFASVILADTEDVWPQLLSRQGIDYAEPQMVLYTRGTQTGCGFGQSAMGPFYCPADQRVYLDLSFFSELDRQLGAPGDFAQAYVIAHEIGHHVQNLTGTADQVHRAQQRMSDRDANALSVRLELQADCYAGIWAHHAQRQRQLLESGDVEEGLRAAASIGDDTLQKRSQGSVVPESFTHGTSAQRVEWFRRGLEAGTLEACDTFGDVRR